jgi:UPF0271 protein
LHRDGSQINNPKSDNPQINNPQNPTIRKSQIVNRTSHITHHKSQAINPQSSIDLNSDMAESFGRYVLGNDTELMPLITSCNLACGFHAGDPLVMQETIALARRHGTRIGAHPGYPDRQGFGRRTLRMSPAEIRAMVGYQIGALAGLCRTQGVRVRYLKPHGALYHDAGRDAGIAEAIVAACAGQGVDRVMGIAGSALHRATEAAGLTYIREAFADRGYGNDGGLLPRGTAGALLTDPVRAAEQAVAIVREGVALTPDGERVPVAADSLCIHGDTPGAVAIAAAIRRALEAAGLRIGPAD